jgi:hypothetical protein
MKRLLVLAAILWAPQLMAQETYSANYGAAAVTRFDKVRVGVNNETCRRLSLSASCTQAQACVAAGAANGAACSTADAVAVDARIYPNTQAGREELYKANSEARLKAIERRLLKEPDSRAVCTWYASATGVERATFCATVGLPSDCDPCP